MATSIHDPFDDGLIIGRIHTPIRKCEVCEARCRVIHIERIKEIVEPSSKLIGYKTVAPAPVKKGESVQRVNFIGINCGCYAKFHRQMAHISTLRKLGGK